MIDDMASLKQAMEQMDAEDPAVAQAAKDRAAQILSDAKLSFAKMADLIEQQRLLLRPKIVAGIKRMDQPAMLGDAAFRDTGTSLRREGQSFGQIAEALALRGDAAPRYEEAVHRPALMQFANELDEPAGQKARPVILSAVLYPFQNLTGFLVIAILAVTLYNGLREFSGPDRQPARSSTAGRRADAVSPASQTPATPVPSGSASNQPSPASTPAPSANEPAAAGSANPPTANDRTRTAGLRSLNDFTPEQLRRNSRLAGPCRGGMGGCYWGGGRY